MKEFLKYTFATVCGLILTGVVFTILGIISLAGMVASTSGTETIVKDRSVFVLELKGSVMERYQENPIMQFLGEDYATYGLDDILTSIRKAKENDKIKVSISMQVLSPVRQLPCRLYDVHWLISKKAGSLSSLMPEHIHKVLTILQVLPIR